LISRSSFRTGSEATLARSWVSVFSAEVTRIYAVRNWTGQSCKQVKDELGWAAQGNSAGPEGLGPQT
jgi:hypothetical protein